jgi:hypothetical protein
MSEQVEIQYNLTISTELATSEIRKLEIVLMRALGYLRRLTGDEQVDRAIFKIQQLITTIRAMQLAMRALELASGPIGWAFAAVSIAGAAFATGEFLNAQG